jgi:holin-like protein
MAFLSQFVIILSFTLAGEALQRLLPFPIPASVYGLLLLFAALCMGLVKVEQVKKTGNFLSSLLPVLFVGPTVAIAEQWELIAPQLFPIALLLLSSTILTFFISGHITQWLLRKGGGCRE